MQYAGSSGRKEDAVEKVREFKLDPHIIYLSVTVGLQEF